MKILFNRTPFKLGNIIEKPLDIEIENTPTLRQASLDTALRFGGTLTRKAIGAMNLTNSRKYIVVDTKIHFLMKGWCPSIPGWHTDGVPRGKELNPAGSGLPDIGSQAIIKNRPPIYHLLVCGSNSLTNFIEDRNIELEVPDEPTDYLYAAITKDVKEKLAYRKINTFTLPECQVITWDWWELHSAEWASERGWRYLIRVTETDDIVPRRKLEEVFRYQNMIFVKSDEIGW